MSNTEESRFEGTLSPELEAQIEAAMAHARDPEDEAVALSAHYDFATDLLILRLKTGRRIALPREDLQGLAGAEPMKVAEVQIVGPGTALHWETLDVDFLVRELAEGWYGTERWMRQLSERRRIHAAAALSRTA